MTSVDASNEPLRNQGEIVIYQTDDGKAKIDVRFENETVWLTQAQLAELYQSSKANISEHIKHIFEEDELEEAATVRKFRTVQNEGQRQVSRLVTIKKSSSEKRHAGIIRMTLFRYIRMTKKAITKIIL